MIRHLNLLISPPAAISQVGVAIGPTLGIIAANRVNLPTALASIGTAPYTSRRSHWSHPDGAISNLVFIDLGWGYPTADSPEANMGTGTRTIKKFVEYPAGTFTQVTWGGGNATVDLAPGGQVVSDPVSITIPAGTQFFERTVDMVTATAAAISLPALPSALGLPDGNVIADQGNTGTIPPTSGTVNTIGSSAILGDVNATFAKSFIAFGDSVLWGLDDVSSVSDKGESGWVRRGLRWPCVMIGRSGQTARAVVSATTKLTAFLNAIKFSHVINQFGINDLRLGDSQTTMFANFQTIFAKTPGKSIYQCTIGPRSDTSDGWSTVGNQTVRTDGNWGALTSVNTAIRAGLANVEGVIEWADAAMSARNSGKWKAPPVWTGDGTHPNSLAAGSIGAIAYNGMFGIAADTTAPTITTSATQTTPENLTFTLSLTANEFVTWSKVGGADQALFSLTDNLLSLSSRDFEAPTDANGDNVYLVTVRATDALGNSTDQTISLTVTDASDVDTTAPTITTSATQSVAENALFSIGLTADEAVTWTKTGGADAALFTLAGSSLSMAAKDFEIPTDANADNVYVVQVTATDGASNATNKTISVTVTNVAVEGGYSFTNGEAATYVAAMTVTPDDTRKGVIDSLVGSLKSAGLWTTLDIICLYAAHDNQAARLNLKDPTKIMTPVNLPVFTTDRGYASDNISKHLAYSQAWNALVNFQQNSGSISAGVRTVTGGTAAFIVGTAGTTNTQAILWNSASSTGAVRINAAAHSPAVAGLAAAPGRITITRENSTQVNRYRNGAILDAALAETSGTPSTDPVATHRVNNAYPTAQINYFAIGSGWTASQVSAFDSAIAAYLTAVGA